MAKAPVTNRLGLTKADYQGVPSTMCQGCGHDRISESILNAAFEMGLESHKVFKTSGIGCSSKTPAYFLGKSFGINTTHGRMPSFTTGAHLANHTLLPIGVSGDGDTASIGIGQFVHMVRRNPRAVYIVENNGVYGLTKGQFSATADLESPSKRGVHPTEAPIDLCTLAIDLGCGFVARSFSGDKKQLTTLLEAAYSHNGLAFLDVISPCVTFNNHDDSTKSYKYHRAHSLNYNDPSFVPSFDHIDIDYDAGSTTEVELHDGSKLFLKKLEDDWDATDADASLAALRKTRKEHKVLTGMIYIDPSVRTLSDTLHLGSSPLANLADDELRPPKATLDGINASLRY